MKDDRGSGTVLALLMAMVLLACGAVCWTLVSVSTARQRSAVAADLAALAAAHTGCEAAAAVAIANSARLDRCESLGGDMSVTVSIDGPHALGPWQVALPRVSASARAGPG